MGIGMVQRLGLASWSSVLSWDDCLLYFANCKHRHDLREGSASLDSLTCLVTSVGVLWVVLHVCPTHLQARSTLLINTVSRHDTASYCNAVNAGRLVGQQLAGLQFSK